MITTRAVENVFLPAVGAIKVEDTTLCGTSAQLIHMSTLWLEGNDTMIHNARVLSCSHVNNDSRAGWQRTRHIRATNVGVKSQGKSVANKAAEKSEEWKYTALGRIGPGSEGARWRAGGGIPAQGGRIGCSRNLPPVSQLSDKCSTFSLLDH